MRGTGAVHQARRQVLDGQPGAQVLRCRHQSTGVKRAGASRRRRRRGGPAAAGAGAGAGAGVGGSRLSRARARARARPERAQDLLATCSQACQRLRRLPSSRSSSGVMDGTGTGTGRRHLARTISANTSPADSRPAAPPGSPGATGKELDPAASQQHPAATPTLPECREAAASGSLRRPRALSPGHTKRRTPLPPVHATGTGRGAGGAFRESSAGGAKSRLCIRLRSPREVRPQEERRNPRADARAEACRAEGAGLAAGSASEPRGRGRATRTAGQGQGQRREAMPAQAGQQHRDQRHGGRTVCVSAPSLATAAPLPHPRNRFPSQAKSRNLGAPRTREQTRALRNGTGAGAGAASSAVIEPMFGTPPAARRTRMRMRTRTSVHRSPRGRAPSHHARGRARAAPTA